MRGIRIKFSGKRSQKHGREFRTGMTSGSGRLMPASNPDGAQAGRRNTSAWASLAERGNHIRKCCWAGTGPENDTASRKPLSEGTGEGCETRQLLVSSIQLSSPPPFCSRSFSSRANSITDIISINRATIMGTTKKGVLFLSICKNE